MALITRIKLDHGLHVEFDLNQGIDLSSCLYDDPPIVDVFGLPSETRKQLYSLDNTSVNVDQLTICCHNNRTHTESTKHIYSDGLNVSECNPSNSFFGCILISVTPIPVHRLNDNEYKYDCGENIDRYNDWIITKSMIVEKIRSLKSVPSLFKQAIFIRVEDRVNNQMIDLNKHWPFLSNDAMQYLHDNISNVFGINLSSVDRMVSPKVPNHRIWFGDPKSTRLITECLSIPNNISDGLYMLNLQLAPIANTDAVPTRPILYPCTILMPSLSKL
eukprot:242949_1